MSSAEGAGGARIKPEWATDQAIALPQTTAPAPTPELCFQDKIVLEDTAKSSQSLCPRLLSGFTIYQDSG